MEKDGEELRVYYVVYQHLLNIEDKYKNIRVKYHLLLLILD